MNSVFVDINYNLDTKSVLVISSDIEFIDSLKSYSYEKCNISFFSENKFYLLNSVIGSFDIIIFDNSEKNLEKFVEVFKLTQSYDLNIPMIIIEDETPNDLSLYKYSNTYTILSKPLNEKNLFSTVELCANFLFTNKKIQFENGFYFDITRELLFQNKKIIKLTKTERKLIKLLVENINQLVTYEEISEIVWYGKNFSIYSLRNVIKHIREKTDESFIKNSSNRGYIINSL
jgi:two-component system, OmpR family, response regulator MprA